MIIGIGAGIGFNNKGKNYDRHTKSIQSAIELFSFESTTNIATTNCSVSLDTINQQFGSGCLKVNAITGNGTASTIRFPISPVKFDQLHNSIIFPIRIMDTGFAASFANSGSKMTLRLSNDVNFSSYISLPINFSDLLTSIYYTDYRGWNNKKAIKGGVVAWTPSDSGDVLYSATMNYAKLVFTVDNGVTMPEFWIDSLLKDVQQEKFYTFDWDDCDLSQRTVVDILSPYKIRCNFAVITDYIQSGSYLLLEDLNNFKSKGHFVYNHAKINDTMAGRDNTYLATNVNGARDLLNSWGFNGDYFAIPSGNVGTDQNLISYLIANSYKLARQTYVGTMATTIPQWNSSIAPNKYPHNMFVPAQISLDGTSEAAWGTGSTSDPKLKIDTHIANGESFGIYCHKLGTPASLTISSTFLNTIANYLTTTVKTAGYKNFTYDNVYKFLNDKHL